MTEQRVNGGGGGCVDPTTHIDNEYSRAGILDPKIIVTTSRDPSSKLLQFAKVMHALSCEERQGG